ncbi:MAG TPA: choice-of-anchor Q domain-containing protein [Verrucomicrobiae bacterium]|nr:choice-of-anchor Q domain-containing protein [Verrucomicrobiae bacterium]
MKIRFCLMAGIILLARLDLAAATLYVSRASTNPIPPYASWSTAATNIQDAVVAAPWGSIVLVSNGVYAGGLSIDKPLTLLSANGPQFTTIDGGGINRCAYITNGTSLSGFTLTNGLAEEAAGGVWCEAEYTYLTNCVIVGNKARSGGGVYRGTLYNCLLASNTASGTGWGLAGGAFYSTLYNCTLARNSASVQGGGVYEGALLNCIVYDNFAPTDANYTAGTLNFCCTTPMPTNGFYNLTNAPLFINETAGDFRLQAGSPCIDAGTNPPALVTGFGDLDGNPRVRGASIDIGAYEFQFPGAPSISQQPMDQTVDSGNDVIFSVGAAGSLPLSWQWWFNGNPLHDATTANLALTSVTTDQAGGYSVVITNSLGSITSRVAILTVTNVAPSVTLLGPLYQTVNTGSNVTLAVSATGSLPLSWQWNFNGSVVSGATSSTLALPGVTTNQAGTYSIVITNAFGSVTSEVAILTVLGKTSPPQPGTKYVWQNSPSPTPPYASWATASHNIYGAVGAARPGDLILVTNGTYSGGLFVGLALTVQSVNGPVFTIIDGAGTNQCVSLWTGAALSGFTLTNGLTTDYGGAVEGGATATTLVTNCVIVGNSGFYGGGAFYCTLYNCTLTGNSSFEGGGAFGCALYNCSLARNSATDVGGGAYGCTLYNCTLTGNSALNNGGGVNGSTLYNCISMFNTAPAGANYDGASTLDHSCATPLPLGGNSNIDLDPKLTDASHISALSPCRGAGSAAYFVGTDIDDEPWANPPDIGCDQYQSGAMTGPLRASLVAAYTNVAVGFPVSLTGIIRGAAALNIWDFGDGTVVSNRPYASHAWGAPGNYVVTFSAFNDSNPAGVQSTATIRVAAQPVLYVDGASANPQPPYASWSTAAVKIQDALNAATLPGSQVFVTNGVYAGGVAVNLPLALQSVNGPRFTAIDGLRQGQCLSLTNDSSASGFTLTNGISYSAHQSGGVSGTGPNAFVTNCVIAGNAANYGGGAYSATLYHCTLDGNSAGSEGGGTAYCTLFDCTLTHNIAGGGGGLGGGATQSILYRCLLASNIATNGGGAYLSTLGNCALTGNKYCFGAASQCTLYNCALTSNMLAGATASTLYNCTLTGNGYGNMGYAAPSGGTFYNCILYYNFGPNYDPYSTLNYCCTVPMPTNGVGNITNEPALAGDWRISSSSPCRGAASSAYVSGLDLDGEPWLNPPSIGCDEFYSGSLTGALSLSITVSWTNVATGFTISLDGSISGRAIDSRWEFGDGIIESNRLHTTHQWAAPGLYNVILRVYNEDHPEGVTASVAIQVAQLPVYYVDAWSVNPTVPYVSWDTAARSIPDALTSVSLPGSLVLVHSGTYSGSVIVRLPLTLLGVNGPQSTVIDGRGTNRCLSLADDVSLSGFTLTNGLAGTGGGVLCKSTSTYLTNCVIVGNSASAGGGVSGGTLYDCTVSNNSATQTGGGADSATLYHCTLSGNATTYGGSAGGGAFNCTLNNCTLDGNKSSNGGGAYFGTLNNCTLTGNQAENSGGGVGGALLNDCLLTGNTASAYGGGGASGCTLNNCTVTGNSAPPSVFSYGGGAYNCVLNNSIVYYNSDLNYSESTLNHCCTTPLPANGSGSITNEPLFIDLAAGNLRLQSASPCINAGDNAAVFVGSDLDGNPRIIGAAVDMGAYEVQGSGSAISYAWLQQYKLPTDGSADYADTDGDGMNNWQEWICGTCPTNAESVLRLVSVEPAGRNVTITWQSVPGVNYFLQRSTLLASPFTLAATNITGQSTNIVWIATNSVIVGSNILGQIGTSTAYTDTNSAVNGRFFYRVGVKSP